MRCYSGGLAPGTGVCGAVGRGAAPLEVPSWLLTPWRRGWRHNLCRVHRATPLSTSEMDLGSSGPNASHTCPSGNGSTGVSSQNSAPFRTVETVLIIGAAGSLSFLTILGNVLVMLSIRVNRHLQNVNNYFLFSLAFADLLIGVFSMNLYTVYMLKGYWPFGPAMCDLWLVVDYVVSNASNMNLVIICVDRYLCVTRPLTYPSRRTRRYASLMVLGAWIVSLVLWAPAILTWQRFRGQRLHQKDECYIQLLSSPAVTLTTAVPSFYLPAILMTVLYARITRAGRRRVPGIGVAPDPGTTATTTGLLRVTTSILLRALPSWGHVPTSTPNPSPRVTTSTAEGATSLDKDSSQHSDQVTRASEASPPSLQSYGAATPAGAGGRRCTPAGGGVGRRCTPALTQPNLCGQGQTMRMCVCDCASERTSPSYGCRSQNVMATTQVMRKRRRRSSVRERKVTRTVLAVLLAFMVTWTPYNAMVLVGTFCHFCVSDTLWTIGYWLRYINSTINPVCYALCNMMFRKTFQKLLLCRYKNINSK
ncbi:hypothetical protein ACEWY4_010738 [Coilia grayii]|uniref:Muscarinic acetylcholine receptor n=1 Tax=Coilia grayii TaxID=363190 RepID=A0ABD1K2S1_9TELE